MKRAESVVSTDESTGSARGAGWKAVEPRRWSSSGEISSTHSALSARSQLLPMLCERLDVGAAIV